MKYEKPLRGNPNKLTVHQHTIPVKCISRFADKKGYVQIFNKKNKKILKRKPKYYLFYLNRVWDQKTESGWMKTIEDNFQKTSDKIIKEEIRDINDIDAIKITKYYVLWYFRSRQQQQIHSDPNLGFGTFLKEEEEEHLEKNGYIYVKHDGRMPGRFLTGMLLQIRVNQCIQRFQNWKWGIIHARAGEFLLPDVPSHPLIPITPKIILAANHPCGIITESNLKEINTAFIVYSWKYYIAHSIVTAKAGISDSDIQRAEIERNKRISSGENILGSIPSAADYFIHQSDG